ncbi:UNKNOWN [Stylonychia lemnae]|uniref:Uncharacterized protein n=1 Tax=Stylonychia lemnae TaxID=5949 RepID=A0A077ZWS5_STYLE|nr:UNKNOWN [Stylonychia lemnae]|eukprot:CDW72946.1 UNKNOWN [Stylonychia lemnae]
MDSLADGTFVKITRPNVLASIQMELGQIKERQKEKIQKQDLNTILMQNLKQMINKKVEIQY